MIAISCSKEVAEPNANQNNNPDRTSYSISIDDLHAYLTEQSTTVNGDYYNSISCMIYQVTL